MKQEADWQKVYPIFRPPIEPVQALEEEQDDQTYSISASDMPVPLFVRHLNQETGLTVIASQALQSRKVTLDIFGLTGPEIISALGKHLQVSAAYDDGVYYLGELRKEDRALLVRRIRRLSSEQINEGISVLLTENGRVTSYPDGVTIVGDTVEVLGRVTDFIKQVENSDSPVWVIQFFLLQTDQDRIREIGGGLDSDVAVSANFAKASLRSYSETAKELAVGHGISGSVAASFRLFINQSRSRVIEKPLFLLGDGHTARMSRGQTIPVPKKAVTESGVIETTEFEQVESGLIFNLQLREVDTYSASLKYTIENSFISGFVETAPILETQELDSTITMQSGGAYLIGSLSTHNRQNSRDRLLSFSKTRSQAHLQVWLMAYRIGGPASEAIGARTAPGGGLSRPGRTGAPMADILISGEGVDKNTPLSNRGYSK